MSWREVVDVFGGSKGIFAFESPNLQVDVILLPPDEFTPELYDKVAYHLTAMGEIIADQS